MSQHDLDIANQTFPNTRSDLNNALQALGSTSSGATVPSTTYANQLWYDTANNKLYIRNEDNDANIEICELDQTNDTVEFFKSDSVRTTLIEYSDGTDALTVGSSGELTTSSTLDVDGNELILDSDGDSSITADTDDQIDIKVGGTDSISITPSQITITDADSNQPRLLLKNTNADANPAFLDFQKDSASPADNDVIGKIRFIGDDDGGNTVAYATIISTSPDVSDGSENGDLRFETTVNGTNAERMRINSDGRILINTTDTSPADNNVVGTCIRENGLIITNSTGSAGSFGRTADGTLVTFYSAGNLEGNISVSGTTVSYNGGHLSRWGRLPDGSQPTILKGTVMSNLDEMVVWSYDDVLYTEEDELPEGKSVGDVKKPAYTAENEQRNQLKVSDVEGDINVAGLFVKWDTEEDGYNDIDLAMTGDMVIRIAQGTTVQRGDLLMSAGDGTAKPQGDDIVRSKTIAKVTSTTVINTYDDGSYVVPCVVMAC